MAASGSDMVAVRRATERDLGRLADVHTAAFPGFVLTMLGKGFLRRYYETILRYPAGILLVAEIDGAAVGFAAGYLDARQFSSALKRRLPTLAPHIIAGILTHPRIFGVVLQNAMGVFRGRTSAYEPPDDEVEFASLGVHPDRQGRGVGRRLIVAMVETARQTGAPAIHLTTDAEANDRTNRLYQAAGFVQEARFDATGGRSRYHYRLPFHG